MENFNQVINALTDDQRRVINEELERRTQTVEAEKTEQLQSEIRRLQVAGEEAISEAKMQFKSATYSCRKPETYDPSKGIKLYMESWDFYKRIMQLRDAEAIQTFMTYLSEESYQKCKVLKVTNERNWESFKAAVISALDKPRSKLAVRVKLRNLKQKRNETLSEFYDRMLQLAAEAFDESEQAAQDDTMKQVLCSGILSDELAVEIIGREDWNFAQALDHALKKDLSTSARKQMKNGSDAEFAILTSEFPPEQSYSNQQQDYEEADTMYNEIMSENWDYLSSGSEQ